MTMSAADSTRIERISAREILNGMGFPTVEVDVRTKGGVLGRASVPTGVSTGSHEAVEVRNGDKRYSGKGVSKAVNNVNEVIAPRLRGIFVTKQSQIDQLIVELDGTENKSRLGVNAIAGVSLAVARTAALSLGVPLFRYLGGNDANILPVPMFNLVNGGKHAPNGPTFQEYHIIPVGAKAFCEALMIGVEIYIALGKLLKHKFGSRGAVYTSVGGFSYPSNNPADPFDYLTQAIEEVGYQDETRFGIDAAASQLYDMKHDVYRVGNSEMNKEELLEFYRHLVATYHILSIEDPFDQEDFEGFAALTKDTNIQVVGDDLFTTNAMRLEKGIGQNAGNAIVLKVNQVGTLSEELSVAKLALRNDFRVVISNRSGETDDTFIADLAVGLGCGQIKAGPLSRIEKVGKYNQLLRIEEQLGKSSIYAGANAFVVKRK